MKQRSGIAKPEENNDPSLTLPAQTRTPLEAFKMLRAGQPIDTMATYYESREMLTKDFYLMDKTERLRALAELREMEKSTRAEIAAGVKQYQESIILKQQQDEQDSQTKQQGNNIKQNQGSNNPGGSVPT